MLVSGVPSAILRHAAIGVACAALIGAAWARADELQEANKLLKAGQYAEALTHANKALQESPGDPQARFLKGLILTEQGNTKEAIDTFEKLTQDYPKLPEPYNNLAVIYASQGNYEKARAALEKSIRTHPSYATAYENLGDVYAKLASQAYDRALQIDSSNSAAKNKLSLVSSLVGEVPRDTKAASATESAAPLQVAAAAPKPLPAGDAGESPKPATRKPTSASKPAVEKVPMAKLSAPAPRESPSAEVLAAVHDWADAWSRRDADAYLSFYASDFAPPEGQSRTAWDRVRRSRVTAPKSISVTIESPQVTLQGDTRATVHFRQIYHSNRFNGTSLKTLVMVKNGSDWRIQQEKVGN
jgi:Flp pilus assembly protein TadD/ketosteroid isomerase-like protein